VGQERECTLTFGGTVARGKALLESDTLVFRGTPRRSLALKDVRDVSAASGCLRVTMDEGIFELDLGAPAHAEAWAQKIRSPRGRLDKLGIAIGAKVTLVGPFDDAFKGELAARGCTIATRAAAATSILILAAEAKEDLTRIPTLRARLADDGTLWIVYRRGHEAIREADVLTAGRAAQLVDQKVARFSETHTALKLVIPKAMRGASRP
jgi:hypothetical protein